MSDDHDWKLLSVEELEKTEPDFFVYPRPTLEHRRTAQLGETLKVAASIERNGKWKTKGIWLQVEDVSGSPNSFRGRPMPSYHLKFGPDSDCTIEFGPEHIYRMEPREYTVWGRDDRPVIVWGNGQHGSVPMTPEEEPIDNIEPLCTFACNGWNAMKVKYAELADEKNWPAFDEL